MSDSKINQKTFEKCKQIMKYTDEELNGFNYTLAKYYDTRTFCEFYISSIKTKHILIFTFFYNKDYNSQVIKIDI